MGVYDQIEGVVVCPHCGKETTVNCQIKWLSYPLRSFTTYHVGDDIPCVDGIYTGASTVRQTLVDNCKQCNHSINFVARVLNGKLCKLIPYINEDINIP